MLSIGHHLGSIHFVSAAALRGWEGGCPRFIHDPFLLAAGPQARTLFPLLPSAVTASPAVQRHAALTGAYGTPGGAATGSRAGT